MLMSVCPTVSVLRFYGCCHPCYKMNIIQKNPLLAFLSGIQRDKTMDVKLICISDDDKKNPSFCRLQLLVVWF